MFRLALAQIDVTVGDLDENSKKILEYNKTNNDQDADDVFNFKFKLVYNFHY